MMIATNPLIMGITIAAFIFYVILVVSCYFMDKKEKKDSRSL